MTATRLINTYMESARSETLLALSLYSTGNWVRIEYPTRGNRK